MAKDEFNIETKDLKKQVRNVKISDIVNGAVKAGAESAKAQEDKDKAKWDMEQFEAINRAGPKERAEKKRLIEEERKRLIQLDKEAKQEAAKILAE